MPSKYIYNKKEKKPQIKLMFKAFCFVSDIINDFVIFLYDLDQFSFVSMFVNCGDWGKLHTPKRNFSYETKMGF